jgi:hypothetical protein
MLIKLIEVSDSGKRELFFQASQIRAVQDSVQNPMLCLVVTNWLTPQGFQSFEVLGRAEDVACEINQAIAGKNNLLQ